MDYSEKTENTLTEIAAFDTAAKKPSEKKPSKKKPSEKKPSEKKPSGAKKPSEKKPSEKKPSTKKPSTKKSSAAINDTTKFAAPIKSFTVKTNKKKEDWICANCPGYILMETEEYVQFKPFNKSNFIVVDKEYFQTNFIHLERDNEYVYTEFYPNGKIEIKEFSVERISLSSIKKHFKNDLSIVRLLEKMDQDSYCGKGNTHCINISDYKNYIENKKTSKLERIGDPYFNRSSRHTPPIYNTFSRTDFENCLSFPAPIGIRAEDFALPSEQNKILIDLITQIFNCVNAPELPELFKKKFGMTIVKNSHICNWCGETVDISKLNQEYCSKEHSINFCHRDPVIGTKIENVYIGHCSCNREQGGYSEEQRFEQFLRLIKNNPSFLKRVQTEIGTSGLQAGLQADPSV
jgi:hypothetical protein